MKLTEKQRTVLRRAVDEGRINPTGDRGTFMVLRALQKMDLVGINLGYPYGFWATPAGRALLAEEKQDA